MKHKAQESLDILSYPAWESPCSGCKCGTSDCRDCKNAVAVLNLEDLINCQLTVEELDELLLTLGLKIHDMDYLQIRNDRFYLLNKIIEKVKKQKEMWVSENETNR